ncbi:4Fe-4S dicluster domain-containing protein [Deferrisoma camini]|uniref:4Fe-4S dicluster domain-containing protein n=1 Tax=Deferrisoma camini TaxID=1035120 RepID=UPI00146E5EB8|nr:4Fe-4S dicluster domain-containing protein [Deferrisoma camini]
MIRRGRRGALRTMLRLGAGAAAFGAAAVAAQMLLRKPRGAASALPVARKDPGRRLVRPPGAVGEPAFLAGCIRCYRCQDACDVGAIRFFTAGDGALFHTPHIDPAVKGCTLCMRCTQVCPTHVLRPLEPRERGRVRMASAELREDLCLSYKAKRIRDEQAMLMALGREPTEATAMAERRGPCGECYMFCPLRERAIRLEPGAFLAPILVKKECVGCGMCEEICRVVTRGRPAIRVVATRGMV